MFDPHKQSKGWKHDHTMSLHRRAYDFGELGEFFDWYRNFCKIAKMKPLNTSTLVQIWQTAQKAAEAEMDKELAFPYTASLTS